MTKFAVFFTHVLVLTSTQQLSATLQSYDINAQQAISADNAVT